MAVQVPSLSTYDHFQQSRWCCVMNENLISSDGCCWASDETLEDASWLEPRKIDSGTLEDLFDDVKRRKFVTDPESKLQSEAFECRCRQEVKKSSQLQKKK
uniref:Uncharacterized protein n=1 Tax=Aureoumbra lagunensis TaxID=44058 RepID=A0A7S3K6J6_9STRA|mmetsp:Transcript_4337/g.6146  ORF Transcript_4337/g.6146 Transcript_4337/m.6146 type:complete len:101 (+) Transcript_4337:84-386(+)